MISGNSKNQQNANSSGNQHAAQNQMQMFQNQDDLANHQQMNSKSILSSFRNGPVKIMGNQSGSQQQISAALNQGQMPNEGSTSTVNKVQQHPIQSMNSYNRQGYNG